jgi:hypothetical protein
MSDGVPTLPERKRRRKGRGVLWHGKAVLGARDLKHHADLIGDGRFKSGRGGEFVYYVRNGQQLWRRYVVPMDPRTAAQQRSRKAFGAAAKAWSRSG